MSGAQSSKDVNMIFHTAHDLRNCFQRRKNSAHISVKTLSPNLGDKTVVIFRGKNQMEMNAEVR